MSFIANANGKEFLAGHFLLDDEECLRVTKTISASHAQVVTRADGSKYVPAGAIFPSNSSSATGIVYEDIDVTAGDAPGSVVVKGVVVESALPTAIGSDAKTALTDIVFVPSFPAINRPDYPTSLVALTVSSAAGTAVGDTAITVSGYTLKTGDGYVYKVATGTAPAVAPGEILDSTWTAWNGTADITAATGKKITVAVVNGFGEAIAAGNATVTAKS